MENNFDIISELGLRKQGGRTGIQGHHHGRPTAYN